MRTCPLSVCLVNGIDSHGNGCIGSCTCTRKEANPAYRQRVKECDALVSVVVGRAAAGVGLLGKENNGAHGGLKVRALKLAATTHFDSGRLGISKHRISRVRFFLLLDRRSLGSVRQDFGLGLKGFPAIDRLAANGAPKVRG